MLFATNTKQIKKFLFLANIYGLSQLLLSAQCGQAADQINGTRQAIKGVKLQVPPAPRVISGTSSIKSQPSSPSSTQDNQVVLQSRDISSYGPSWQTFSDYLSVPKGCDQIPLSLVLTNGRGNGPRFQDLRISLAGKSLGTIRDFAGKQTLTRNLSGALGVGDSLLTIQAYGPSGAELNWKFVTPRVVVTRVNPNTFALNDKIAIDGQNFSDRPNMTQVFIDKKPATVISAKSTHLEIKAPTSALGGKADLVVAVGPSRSLPYKVTIKSSAEIQGVNLLSSPAGQPITITGKGFSPVASENKVMIGGMSAQITSCSSTTIDCIIPEPGGWAPTYDVPIKVITNGVEAKDPENKGKIDVQVRVF